MYLSNNFTTEEATISFKADSLHIDNSLPEEQLNNAKYLAKSVLQPVRDKIGIPLNISSWYRCPALNKAIGGVKTSAHLNALAVDFVLSGHTALESFNIVLKALNDLKIEFDQLIIEKNTKTGANWVHLGIRISGNRNQAFSITL